jgi:hypothetical protein
MTDIAQASNVASNPAIAANAMLDHAALCRRFDGRMHGLMAQAKSEDDWNSISTILLKALENKNLRANVRRRFVKECPNKTIAALLEIAVELAKPEKQKVNEAANELFDDRQFRAMERAQCAVDWIRVFGVLEAAAKRNNLRSDVLRYFVEWCPHTHLVDGLRTTVFDAQTS